MNPVYLDNNADSPRVNIALDEPFTRFAVAFFLGLRQTFFA